MRPAVRTARCSASRSAPVRCAASASPCGRCAVGLRGRLVETQLRALLAVAGDHEQAVVDCEPQPETDDDVQRELRKRQERVDDAQRQEGGHDGDAADEQRHQRRDDPPEDEQREDEKDRERQSLGLAEVLADLAAELLAGDRGTTEQHRRRALHPFQQPFGGFGGAVVRHVLEERRHVRRAAVARHERAAAGGVVRERPRHRGVLAELGGDACDQRAGARRAHASRRGDERDHLSTRPFTGRVADHLVHHHALGGVVVERIVGVEHAGDRRADRDRDHEEDPDSGQDAPRVAIGEARQPAKQAGLPGGWRSRGCLVRGRPRARAWSRGRRFGPPSPQGRLFGSPSSQGRGRARRSWSCPRSRSSRHRSAPTDAYSERASSSSQCPPSPA